MFEERRIEWEQINATNQPTNWLSNWKKNQTYLPLF